MSLRRVLASAINVLIVLSLTLPLADNRHWKAALVLTFLTYNLACELLVGCCIGCWVMGLRWSCEPSRRQRVAFCYAYTAAFSSWVFLPEWQAVPHLIAQWLWGKFVGGTIHSWVAGLRSE